ncbi:uncharacterized protein CEXT_118551 [Caerostris extrusa]|uniref:Uncharacterized protein n=1 Tax=Caerostris extrusa TaxID=172846 RepID=A0AAV4RC57_CAEEX|nr:uncharacterized protein CEXT_118551 [Caerostris extrusa]
MHKIQQVLQEKPWEDTINVNPSCQKAVVKFFSTANEIMKIIGQQAELIENYTRNNATLVSKSYDAELQSKLQNIILGLARRIDTISRFREHMPL